MNASKYKHLDVEIIRLYDTGKCAQEIARILSTGKNTPNYRLRINGFKLRSISECLVGRPKSEEHRIALSKSRIDKGVAKGSKNPNWKGGITSEHEKVIAAMKRNPKYKAWRKIVLSVGFCKACGSKVRLEAHHILPKVKFPNLIHDIDNGICLCRECHKALHSKRPIAQSARIAGNSYRKDGDNPQPSLERGRFNDHARAAKAKIWSGLHSNMQINNSDLIQDFDKAESLYDSGDATESVVKNGVNSVDGRTPNTEPSQGIANRLLEGVETRPEETIMAMTPCTKVKI